MRIFFFVFFIIALLFIGMTAGSAGMFFDLPYVSMHKNAYEGIKAWREKQEIAKKPLQTREDASPSVVINRPGAFPGYTLLTYGWKKEAVLLDMDGRTVHQWAMPYYTAWPDPPHLSSPLPENRIFWHDVYLYPNGDLLAIYDCEGDFPFGYGLVKIDKDSKVLWRYDDTVHHYMDVDEATGKIYVLSHQYSWDNVPGVPVKSFPIVRDYLSILSPEGKLIKKISLLDALARSPYKEYVTLNGAKDVLHSNRPLLIRENVPLKAPYMKPGQVIVSLRDLDSLVLFDVEKEEAVKVWRGPWRGQHNPELLPNGDLLVFDNKGIRTEGGKNFSRIIEFDPGSGQIVWTYENTGKNSFSSAWAGTANRLPNGNTLISETWGTQVLEVTPEKEVVWEANARMVHQARRYSEDQLPFLKQ